MTIVSTSAIAQQLKLRLGDVSMNKLSFILAYDEGIYKRNGIDILPKFTQGSVNTIRRNILQNTFMMTVMSANWTKMAILTVFMNKIRKYNIQLWTIRVFTVK